MAAPTRTDANKRRLVVANETKPRPAYVVWELTLACDQPCTHCGSRAGDARANELSTARALEVVSELAALGTSEVVLIGGEAYLHSGFLDIARAIAAAGISCVMTTGGRGITRELAVAMKDAGVSRVSVSIDGLEPTHDLMRAARGSFRSAMAALDHLARAGIVTSANTNVNRLNRADLEELFALLADAGIASWQVQLTAPLGRAADRPQMLLQPYDLLDVVPRIARLKERAIERGILLLPGNNLGYFGPEEALLRSLDAGGDDHWQGCQAGRFVMGIESDGAVKGCPSLQTAHYVGGSLADKSLADIWGTLEPKKELWGYCAECPFADVCGGGCTFTAHAFFGRPGNQPYCHFRARAMREQGLRERVVPRDAAKGLPFDNGLFAIELEPFDAPEPDIDPPRRLVQLTRRPTQ